MLSLPGQFTFTADRPQLHCAAFLIAEPEEFITIHYDLVSIDCQGGDFLKVRLPARPRRRGPEGGTGRDKVPSAGCRAGSSFRSGRGVSRTAKRSEPRPAPEGLPPCQSQGFKFPSVRSREPALPKP